MARHCKRRKVQRNKAIREKRRGIKKYLQLKYPTNNDVNEIWPRSSRAFIKLYTRASIMLASICSVRVFPAKSCFFRIHLPGCFAKSRGKKSEAAANTWSRDRLKVPDQADTTNLTGNEKTPRQFSSLININLITLVFLKNFFLST